MINLLQDSPKVLISDFRKVSSQTIWQIISKVATSLSTFIILGLVSRTFGQTGTGAFTLALTYLGFFYLATDLGLNAFFLPRLSINKEELNSLFNARLIMSFALILLANIGTFFLPFADNNFKLLVLIGSLTITFNSLLSSFNLIFQNQLKYEYSMAATSLGAFFNVVVVAFLCTIHTPLYLLALGTLFSTLVTAITSYSLVSSFYKFSFNFSQSNFIINTLKSAWPMMLTLGLNTVYFRVDTFILSSHYSMAVVGTYNLAYQIFQSMLVVPTFIMNSFYPILIADQRTRVGLFVRKVLFSSIVLLSISIIALVLTWIFSPLIIKLITGSDFGGSSVALNILSLGLPAFFVTSLLMMVLIIFGKYKPLAAVYAVGLLVNVILNLVWIPQFSFIAASWVTVVSEYLILILQLLIVLPLLREQNQIEENNI
ncbi:MAG: flippase [Candidatus Daviesbacteria bacterium]|nr:flippase [Candidatus Daviesbacteria bacterium]